jgi:hypothetical protein
LRGGCVGGDGWEDVDMCKERKLAMWVKERMLGVDNEKDWDSLMRKGVGGLPQTVVGI